jgi:hypothetical protein
MVLTDLTKDGACCGMQIASRSVLVTPNVFADVRPLGFAVLALGTPDLVRVAHRPCALVGVGLSR